MTQSKVLKAIIFLFAALAICAALYQFTRPTVNLTPTVSRDQVFGTWKNQSDTLVLAEDGFFRFETNGIRYDGTWGCKNEELVLAPPLYKVGLFPRVITIDGELRILRDFRGKKSWDGDPGFARVSTPEPRSTPTSSP